MKKLLCTFLIFLMMFQCGCSNTNTNPKITEKEQSTVENQTTETIQNQRIVLPNVNVFSANWDNIFQTATQENVSGFEIMDRIGNQYWGVKSESHLENPENPEITSTDLLIDTNSKKETQLTYPANFPDWQVASGSYVVLNDQYLYEWKSYTSQFDDATKYDMKLTCLDVKSGEVSIISEVKSSTPFIYLCQIDNNHFLSYYTIKAESDKVEYATLTVAEIYDIQGAKKEIICEKFENDVSWTDSEGTLIERFAVKDGEIYGFGRRQISGEYKFFLYHYDINGKLLETEAVLGFENIIGAEQPLKFSLVGDYIVFSTYESLTSYLCKRTENGIELISKGARYAISAKNTTSLNSPYIFFIESNVNPDDDTIIQKDCPLYALDVESGEIKAVNFPLPFQNAYFCEFKALSNGDLLVTYCEGGYDPMNKKQFLLPRDKLYTLFSGA